MSDNTPNTQPNDTQQVTEARSHISGMHACVCTEAFAHHQYWARYFARQIADEKLRAQIQAELREANQRQPS